MRKGNYDTSYANNRAPGRAVREANKICPHNHGKTLHGNVFRCNRCGEPRGFFRDPRAKR